jgi:hypothetical protein
MCHHGGAAHSCSSFADLVIKTEWEVEAKLDLTSHPVFMTRSGANVTPIGQQNPPGPLKLSGLRENTGKNTNF